MTISQVSLGYPVVSLIPKGEIFTHTDGSLGVMFFTSVCLSACFSARCLKNGCSKDHQTWNRNVPPWVLETHLFSGRKVKDQGHEAQNNSAGVGFFTLMSVGFF